jgi:hypothetical protein
VDLLGDMHDVDVAAHLIAEAWRTGQEAARVAERLAPRPGLTLRSPA